MKPPVFFESKLPAKLGELVGSKWQGVTLPPMGIFFKKAKKDVPEKLFKHELKHWYQWELLGPLYYPVMLLDYKISGYEKSFFEAQAKAYEQAPLAPVERIWWNSY